MSDYEEDEAFDELLEEGDDVNTFSLGTCLKAPHTETYTTLELHKLIHEGVIDVNPAYQRDVVWPDAKQMKLIDSIFHNFYIPPVVFAVYTDEEGEEVKCCVDGKQRLTSIQKFFDGKIAYKHHETGKLWWYILPESRKKARLEIPERYKTVFANKVIHCIEYQGLPHAIERDLFQRVQLGVVLTPAEKLQAISSPWTAWISDLQQRFVHSEDSLPQKISVSIKRGQDFQLIAGLVYCCDMLPEESQPSSKNLDIWLSNMKPPNKDFKSTINDVLTRFWHIANETSLNHPFRNIQKRVAPAEFIFIGVIIYILRNRPAEEQADLLYEMRTEIRKKHPDIRLRPDIIRDIWAFVNSIIERKSKRRKTKRAEDSGTDYDEEHRPQKQLRQ